MPVAGVAFDGSPWVTAASSVVLVGFSFVTAVVASAALGNYVDRFDEDGNVRPRPPPGSALRDQEDPTNPGSTTQRKRNRPLVAAGTTNLPMAQRKPEPPSLMAQPETSEGATRDGTA